MIKGTFVRDKQALAILDEQILPVKTMVWSLLKNPSFMLAVISIANVMNILIAIQFFAVEYSINVLHGEPNYVRLAISGLLITAPLLGSLLGGLIISRFEGGYTSPKALPTCLFV